ncbi:hypothetical protein QBC47DRAFT_386823 [Echria macrotheca]|uniref:Uncharacterized protein n=1 Tax=Echria macrotheca TaxID=438768 RepID=A0AAJ0B8G5_9PEZI|nr:hypothetical protein QBC47DRAFT_386823 [Echria macrotheca]
MLIFPSSPLIILSHFQRACGVSSKMESTIRRLASIRRPKTAHPGGTSPSSTEKPIEEEEFRDEKPALTRMDTPELTLTRTDSNFVDPSDPAAALAAAATEMVVGLVRRAKSTRGPRRMNSTAANHHNTGYRPAARERTRSLDLPTHMSRLDADQFPSEAAKTALKSRPSIRDRLKSRMGSHRGDRSHRPADILIAPPVPCADPKTPTDPQFRYRPKRGGADLTHLASTLQVPRDSADGGGGAPSSPGYNRLSFDKSAGEDVLSQKPRSPRPSEQQHSPQQQPAAAAVPAQLSPDILITTTPEEQAELHRAPGECRRCHSKRVQRTLSARTPSSTTTGAADRAAPARASDDAIAKRPLSDGTNNSNSRDVFGDYHFVVTTAETATATKPPTSPIPVFVTSSSDTKSENEKEGGGGRPGHVKQAPSWASYSAEGTEGGGAGVDVDDAKVREHRKSLQPLLGHAAAPARTGERERTVSEKDGSREVVVAELPPRTLRRQRSVAQRIVDFVRPASKRGVKVNKFF